MENSDLGYGKFRERIVGALQRRIGPAMPFTYKHIAQLTGKHPQTVRAWCEMNQRIADEDMGVLFKLFGPSFFNEIYGDTGCTLFRIEDARRAKELQDAIAVIQRATGGQ